MSVTLYTQPGCGPCVGVKSMLKRKGLEFNEVNIREDAEGLSFIQSVGATGTPVLILGDEPVLSASEMRDRIAAL